MHPVGDVELLNCSNTFHAGCFTITGSDITLTYRFSFCSINLCGCLTVVPATLLQAGPAKSSVVCVSMPELQ